MNVSGDSDFGTFVLEADATARLAAPASWPGNAQPTGMKKMNYSMTIILLVLQVGNDLSAYPIQVALISIKEIFSIR
mgnify:CR=1 FL=1